MPLRSVLVRFYELSDLFAQELRPWVQDLMRPHLPH